MQSLVRRTFLVLVSIGVPSTVFAHAMGDVFALNLPFSYLALGATAALFYSFAAFAVFSDAESVRVQSPRILATVPSIITPIARVITLTVLVFVIVEGIYGPQGEGGNIAPLFLWVYVLLGGAYTSLFLGEIWTLINPFYLITARRGIFPYPKRLSYVPALLAYVALICIELFSGGLGAQPHVASTLLIGYVFVTMVGAALYGRDDWFTYGDFFAVFFTFISRASLVTVSDGRIAMPGIAARLVSERAIDLTALAFISFMLASTSFDGLYDTRLWHDSFSSVPGIAGLCFVWGMTIGLYVSAVQCTRMIAAPQASVRSLVLAFTYTLIPIAIAYNIAHYFTLLTGPIEAHAVWAVQVAVVVIGHVYATYAAHRVALNESQPGRLLIGQLPMLLMMVLFTVFALWILTLGIQPE